MGQDLWESAPPTIEGDGWKPDTSAFADNGFTPDDGFHPDGGAAVGDGFDGDLGDNVSKHARGAHNGGCRNCGEDGHFARDCPNERVEREFTGECNQCGEVGHRRADCPSRPAQTCKLCGVRGHIKAECTVNRLTYGMTELSVEDAWIAVETADEEKEVDEIKAAILAYAKAYPYVTFEELESVFREARMHTFLIAKDQCISDTHTIVNLQGKPGMKYAVSIQFTNKPRRAKFAEGWPGTPEENITRLSDAGFIMDSLQPKCRNCDQMGHISAKCPEEKREAEKVEIKCGNCNEVGHRYRDCPQDRKSGKKGCRRCGGDHLVKDCDQEPDPSEMTCRKCGENGHMARDCPDQECFNCGQKGHGKSTCENERAFKCHNCEKWGHTGRECPEPKDWSKVQCNNCKEFGHTIKRCPNPPAETEGEGAGGGDDDGGW